MKTNLLILAACAMFCVTCSAGGKPKRSELYRAHTTELPAFDRVRLYALRGEPKRGDEGFPILAYDGAVCEIIGEVQLTGERAAAICDTWRKLNHEAFNEMAMCHLPPYGFRFYVGDEMVFQTSVCWGCNNFYGPDESAGYGWYPMGKDKASAHLLKLCRKFLPHPDLGKKRTTAEQIVAPGAADHGGSTDRELPSAAR